MTHSNRASEAAIAIWQAGVDEVRSSTLLPRHVSLEGETLRVLGNDFDLSGVKRISVVGAGKAAGFMAKALEGVLRPLDDVVLTGWVNVPADCLIDTERIHLHAARPAGINEPRAEGVEGTQQIEAIVAALNPADLCICLFTGGGSALLPAPVPGISLANKLAVTKSLSAAGASIQEMNRVRIELSTLKGGGLARACGAQRLIALIISDILGDPLDLIASGPTVDSPRQPQVALDILAKYAGADVPRSVVDYLQDQVAKPRETGVKPICDVHNFVLGNNVTAVNAAKCEAERRGFRVEVIDPESPDTPAEVVGRELARRMESKTKTPTCLVWGGEPVVTLVQPPLRGKGGRNQQLVLAALIHWIENQPRAFSASMCLLSGGTDGEDGPTDAAGAFINSEIMRRSRELQLDPSNYLERNDAYSFFEQVGGLLKTGPTQTNVCDLRVAILDHE